MTDGGDNVDQADRAEQSERGGRGQATVPLSEGAHLDVLDARQSFGQVVERAAEEERGNIERRRLRCRFFYCGRFPNFQEIY